MKNILSLVLVTAVVGSINYSEISPTAGVCLVGGVMKAGEESEVKKYKRKDCPVCKGKGWYISGDGIAKVDCGYCEPETEASAKTEIIKG